MKNNAFKSDSGSESGIKSARANWEVNPEHVELGQKLGTGAYGIVYRAKLHGVDVAVKLLNLPSLNQTELTDFQNEISIMKDIHHPNVVLFMGACTQSGHLMIVTEYCGMGSVEDLLYKPQPNPLSFRQKLIISKETALGVNWLHNMQPVFLHRDLKPANILLDSKFTVKIADFGLSTIITGGDDDGRNEVAGTPFYMAPEILLERTDYDSKVDVFSYSINLYEIFTGLHPYQDHVFESFEEFVEVIAVHHQRLPIPQTLPPELKSLIEHCWENDPSRRPNFDQVLVSLERIISSHP